MQTEQPAIKPFTKLKLIIGAAVVGLVVLISVSVDLITDSWWFDAVGFKSVFYTAIEWEVSVGVVAFLFTGLMLYINFRLADHFTRNLAFQVEISAAGSATRKIVHLLAAGFSLFVSYVVAQTVSENWQMAAEYLNAHEAGVTDPIFNHDISFYLFQYPFYRGLRSILIAVTALSLVLSLAVYGLKGAIQLIKGWKRLLTGSVKTHITILLTLLVFLSAWGFWLDRYEILYSSDGVVFGAGYTDVHARIAGYYTMMGVTILTGILFIVSAFRKDLVLLLGGLGLTAVALVVMVGIYPWFQQKFVVEPNELEKEKPFIQNNITYTRKAYDLDSVERRSFAINDKGLPSMQSFSATAQNIRLWDWRPLLSTYRQIQEIRLYYRFHDVDLDRYIINGDYRQVMLAARELDYTRIPAQAKTWVNEHIKYTHGYGIVMSPVNKVTEQGMPHLFIKDIPPVSSIDMKIERPEIYYGELTSEYIFTGATTDEFDYPMGDKNSFTRYKGKGGVKLDSLFRRLLYAIKFKTAKLLISEYIDSNTKIHYDRIIRQRVHKIAPFLRYDRDPYLSVIDGRLLWIIDAYTVSKRYPYAEPADREGTNYIRNSVKVIVDAYDGDIHFYLIDETDPLVKTYAGIYPELFTSADKIPPQVKKHFRYPVDQFMAQASMYLGYHMSDPTVFYNREDMWRMPREMYDGNEKAMEPYYLIMPLPGEKKAEYLLVMPFTPVKKNNMIAWMTARSDGEDYGKLVLYEFPKKELVYGPMQIEARIDQDPDISELLTLWSQKGSNVIRGNLLVIPYEGNVLYVEPLYLRAEQAQMPELKRVIVAYKNIIAMEETLDEALRQVFRGGFSDKAAKDSAGLASLKELINAALATFNRSEQALSEPDWAAYGRHQKELKSILEQLKQTEAREK